MKKIFTSFLLLSIVLFFSQANVNAQPNVTLNSATIPAGIAPQGASDHIVYAVQMSVTTAAISITAAQVNLSGTHDNNDLGVIRVYFNASAASVTGATYLGGITTNFAAPHLYNIPANRTMAAGSSGYFIVTVDVNSAATDGNTIKVDGAANPVTFTYSTAPNLTNSQTDVAGVQTIEGADITYATSTIAAGTAPQGTTDKIVYAVQMNVATLPVIVTALQVNLLGTHDNNDLGVIRVYFNASAASVTGATYLGGITANFAGPHLYNIPANRSMAAGSNGYFIVTVDVNTGATDGNTIKVNGATDPVSFTYNTMPNITNSQMDATGVQTIEAADITYTTSTIAAGIAPQGTTDKIVYALQMNVATLPVTVTALQVNLLGSHDNNDLGVIRVYFNASAVSITGATYLGGITTNFAAPHLYNIPANRTMAAGSSGYFIITVDVNSAATDGNTIKVNGFSDPVTFSYITAPNITNAQTDAAGTQTIEGADITYTTSAIAAGIAPQGTTDKIVYAVQMNVNTLGVTVNSALVNLLGTHDNNDLGVIRVYFNASAVSITGATYLGGVSANFAGPHLYNISINRPMAAGSSGYFIITVDVNSGANDGNTIKVNGVTDPVSFGYNTAPNITNNQTDAAGTQTILAAGAVLTSAAVQQSVASVGASDHIVYAVQMNVSGLSLTVTNAQVNLLGTHDNNDLGAIRVYFNASAVSLSGATYLGGLSANFAGPHLYNIPANRTMAAGSSGYFIITVDISSTATLYNTIKVNGATDPVVFGFSTTPTVVNNQTDIAGTQFIGGVLPVTLTSFTGKLVNNSIQLSWRTSSEIDNAYFDIEHCTDAINYVKLGSIDGKGTTSTGQQYGFMHQSPKKGNNFYRLKQVDRNGNYKYSGIVQMIFNTKTGLFVQILSNPVKNIARLSISSTESSLVNIQLTDVSGRMILQEMKGIQKGDNNLQLNVGRFTNGIYHLFVFDEKNNRISVDKIAIQN